MTEVLSGLHMQGAPPCYTADYCSSHRQRLMPNWLCEFLPSLRWRYRPPGAICFCLSRAACSAVCSLMRTSIICVCNMTMLIVKPCTGGELCWWISAESIIRDSSVRGIHHRWRNLEAYSLIRLIADEIECESVVLFSSGDRR